jgi:YD repeat-containing protein
VLVASHDHRELYAVSGDGRHQATLDAVTGTTLWTFGYDDDGRLETITDTSVWWPF